MGVLRKADEFKTPRDVRPELVNAIGALTTVLSLAIAYALRQRGTNIMLQFAYTFVPIGTIGLGLAAASGYVITAWYTGLKMSRRLIVGIVAQLAIAYVIAHYEQYLSSGSALSFWVWFDKATRAIQIVDKAGQIEFLEEQGYLVRVLELVGFTFGGWLWPAALAKKPYCDPCRRYQRTSSMAWLAAGPKRPTEQFARIDRPLEARIRQDANEVLAQLFAHARDGDSDAFVALRDRVDQTMSTIMSLTSSLRIDLHHCPGCFAGKLVATMITGQGGQRSLKTPAGELTLDASTARALANQPSTIGYLPMVPSPDPTAGHTTPG